MFASVPTTIPGRADVWFLIAVLCFVNLYSFSTLTTKPAYWYDEALNVELAHNFADFGKLDLIVAPRVFSGSGALVGSTGYPVTVPLAGFFKLFGFGLSQARIYMLLFMSALVVAFFFVARELWETRVAYAGTLLIATFAPFYGNGRSVMGEIPGFLFFLLSFYFLEKRKWWQSGVFLGLALISKPSVFVFLIPAYALILLLSNGAWKQRIINLIKVGASAMLSLLPWLIIYAGEIARGGLWRDIVAHFKNPYSEAGAGVLQNIGNNLPMLATSTTLLYLWVMLAGVVVALFAERMLFSRHKNLFVLAGVYLPLSLFQYLKSFGYLRYLIAAELLVFILFLVTLPVLVRFVLGNSPFAKGSAREEGGILNNPHSEDGAPPFLRGKSSGLTDSATSFKKGGMLTGGILAAMILAQTVHLFWFSDIYSSEKTQKTMAYISREYPQETVGVFNVPQIASLIPADKKYQYLSTYGLWQFGVNPFLLSPERRPNIIVTDTDDPAFSTFYEKDSMFSEGFSIYKKK